MRFKTTLCDYYFNTESFLELKLFLRRYVERPLFGSIAYIISRCSPDPVSQVVRAGESFVFSSTFLSAGSIHFLPSKEGGVLLYD